MLFMCADFRRHFVNVVLEVCETFFFQSSLFDLLARVYSVDMLISMASGFRLHALTHLCLCISGRVYNAPTTKEIY